MFRLIIAIVSLFGAAQLHAQTGSAKPDRPTITKAYGKLFAIALVCDELDASKTGAAKKLFIEHVVNPTARINDKFAPGGQIRNMVDNPPEKMLTETRTLIKGAQPSKLKELRVECADYERAVKELGASIHLLGDVAQSEAPPPASVTAKANAVSDTRQSGSDEDELEGPIPATFSSILSFQVRVELLWRRGRLCIDPEREKYKSVIELWNSKLAPKITEKLSADFAKSFARFNGPEDPGYEASRIKTVIPSIADECRELESNVQKLIFARVP
jgi:hypothetical protein